MALDPYAPPARVRDENAERVLGEVLAAIRDLSARQAMLEDAFQTSMRQLVDNLPAPAPVDLTPVVDRLQYLAELVAKQPTNAPLPPEVVEALRQRPDGGIGEEQWNQLILRLTDAVRPHGTMVLGGGGREFRVKNANQDIINPATEETVTTLATQATLADALTRLASIDDALNNIDSTVQASSATVPASAFTDVVTLTRATAVTVVGFNADVDSLLDVRYRYRLTVDGVVKISEVVTSGRVSWMQVTVDVGANSTIRVQVFHNEAAPVDFQASIAYRE